MSLHARIAEEKLRALRRQTIRGQELEYWESARSYVTIVYNSTYDANKLHYDSAIIDAEDTVDVEIHGDATKLISEMKFYIPDSGTAALHISLRSGAVAKIYVVDGKAKRITIESA